MSIRPVIMLGFFAVALVTSGMPVYSAAADAGGSAQEVMTRLEGRAAAERKNIVVSFGASWCGNCRKFDMFLNDRTIHPILDKVFVFADLNTGERDEDKRHANIAGGKQLQASLGGKDSGYPYIAMLDANGSLITDSLRPTAKGKENVGYPDSAEEIDWFMEMLNKAAPSLSAQEMTTLRHWLSAHSSGH